MGVLKAMFGRKRRRVMSEQTCPWLEGGKVEELVASIGYLWIFKVILTVKRTRLMTAVPRREGQ
jgi:hypothetical protein